MSSSPKPLAEVSFEESELLKNIQQLPDPRTRWTKHSVLDIVTIAVMAVLSGSDDWNAIQVYGEAKQEWLSGFLSLPNGIPSHDTFNSVISRLEPSAFAECCLGWMKEAAAKIGAQIISIDGKSFNNSYDREKGQKSLHLVSPKGYRSAYAWVSSHHLLLGQVKTEKKSNEITAIPKLLELIDVKGHIVTIDAMGAQKKIANQIVKQEGDYVISLKGNQGTLHENVKKAFAEAVEKEWEGVRHETCQTIEAGHGRLEKRRYYLLPAAAVKMPKEWSTVQSVVMVERERTDWKETSHEVQYHICSLPANLEKISTAIRRHWGVENQLHWSMDVVFGEDQSRIRTGHGAENFGTMRRQTLGLLKRDTTLKKSIRLKRYHAAMNDDYLTSVLFS
jgi:predicted transposase YbfD/YdcC